MNVLVVCEESQKVTIEFRKLGHQAYSCDLLECSGNHPEWHIKKDVTLLLNGNCIFNTVDGLEHEISGKWDMIIAFPPCTYLTVTGNRWFNYEKYGDKAMATQWGKTEKQTVKDNTIIAKIENINHCPNQNTCCIVSPFVHCNYNYKSDSCIKAHKNFIHDCEQVYKHMKARSNPEWHHVSLRTLANIDNDMLDKKRRLYMRVYRMTVNVVNSIYKCNRLSSIDKLRTNLIQTVRNMAKNGAIEWALVCYVKAKIDNCYLVKGLQSSFYSVTYNNKKSRSYTKTFYI